MARPQPGQHNFFRGGPLTTYADETVAAINVLGSEIDRAAVEALWERASATTWTRPPSWFHGDVAADNRLIRNGHISAVIDFGCCGVGDPACDAVIAWTQLDHPSRAIFRRAVDLDADTWARGRGWALWKALITLVDQLQHSDDLGGDATRAVIQRIITDRTT